MRVNHIPLVPELWHLGAARPASAAVFRGVLPRAQARIGPRKGQTATITEPVTQTMFL